jgi:hypothetical protein
MLFRLSKRDDIQVICVGPVIDLYGRFAAEKLARLMEMYPEKVFSKPEFTALPPFLFSGADFALIPSRDEPFGLVAVEFGRKGALGVGSRLGGLGLMPGWVSVAANDVHEPVLTSYRAVVPCRVNINISYAFPIDKDRQSRTQVHRTGTSSFASTIGSPAVPGH